MKPHLAVLTVALLWVASATGFAQFESNVVRTFTVAPGGKFVLHADQGDVEIQTGDLPTVEVQVIRRVQAESPAKAAELFAGHVLKWEHHDNVLTLESKDTNSVTTTTVTGRSSWWSKLFGGGRHTVITQAKPTGLKVSFRVQIPTRFDIDIHTVAGPICAGDLQGEAKLETSGGSITLGHVHGPVSARTYGGNIQLAAADKSVQATTSSGNIQLGEVGGDVELQTYGGSIVAQKLLGHVEATTSSGGINVEVVGSADLKTYGGSITLNAVRGNVTAATSSGSITLGKIDGDLKARTYGGRLVATTVKGRADIQTSGGDIKLGQVEGDVNARTYGGSVSIQSVKGRVVAKTSSGNVNVDQLAGDIEARTYGGNISAGLIEQPKRNCQLETSSGNIELSLTNTVAVELHARAAGGDVTVELPMTELISSGRKTGTVRAKINGGGPVMDLEAHGGAVRVKKF